VALFAVIVPDGVHVFADGEHEHCEQVTVVGAVSRNPDSGVTLATLGQSGSAAPSGPDQIMNLAAPPTAAGAHCPVQVPWPC
jgi:hypothetical protein